MRHTLTYTAPIPGETGERGGAIETLPPSSHMGTGRLRPFAAAANLLSDGYQCSRESGANYTPKAATAKGEGGIEAGGETLLVCTLCMRS